MPESLSVLSLSVELDNDDQVGHAKAQDLRNRGGGSGVSCRGHTPPASASLNCTNWKYDVDAKCLLVGHYKIHVLINNSHPSFS